MKLHHNANTTHSVIFYIINKIGVKQQNWLHEWRQNDDEILDKIILSSFVEKSEFAQINATK